MLSWIIFVASFIGLSQTTTKNSGIFHLDWLCLDEGTYARNVPWDCSGYIVCIGGVAYSFHCPRSQTYNAILSTCEYVRSYGTNDCLQNPFNYLDRLCLYNPKAKIASRAHCSQYFDCSQVKGTWRYSKYVLECPYPDQFSTVSGKCENFEKVNCGTRKEAKSPCDYVQYQQICTDPTKCSPCNKRHPSCVGKTKNGLYPVSSSVNYFMVCFQERTLLVKKCQNNKTFSSQTSKCV